MINPMAIMAGSEVFRLHFNHFGPTVSTTWQSLRHEKDFCDVTLACDDNQVQAHKLVLSTCSPVFKQMLSQNPHQHPLLYFRGVKGSELVHLLDFIYQGEAHIDKEDLNSFLAVAQDLKVKGLTENAEPKQIQPPPQIQPVVEMLEEPGLPCQLGRKRKSSAKEDSPKSVKKERKESEKKKRGRKGKKDEESEPELEQLQLIPEQLIIKPEPIDLQQIVDTSAILGEGHLGQYNIDDGYDSFPKDTSDTVFDNMTMAEFLAKREAPIKKIIDPEQNGLIFSCEECDYQSPRKYNLSKHVESVHQGVRHPCFHCNYKATNRSNLKTHVRKKHIMGPIHDES